MDEQLYLFEVFIDTIYFEECVEEVPPKKQIVVGVKLGNIITLEIRSESLPVRGEGPKKRLVDFKAGRSYLCSLSSEKLIETLDRKPFEVTVGVRGDVRPIGTSNAPWDDCFKEMVLDSTNFPNEYTSPASIVDNFCLMDSGAIKGNVQLLLRLSCFGTSVQTQFEVNQDSGHSQFVFKSANMATTFMCTKFGTGTSNDFIPFYPIYNVAGQLRTDLSEKISQGMIKKSKSTTSWTTYLDRDTGGTSLAKKSSTHSECMFPEYLNIKLPSMDSIITFDIVSLVARPEEDRFLDFFKGKKIDDMDSLSVYSTTMTGECFRSSDEKLPNGFTTRKRPFLRLRGGGHLNEFNNPKPHRLRAGAPTKSPVAECKEIMDQFDKILEEYRKALSPCGELTCSYAPNITETFCKSTCAIIPSDSGLFGCGLPHCPYANYKASLAPIDEDIEKQFIGPAIIGGCGHPKCNYHAETILPPIHWDCPDPLPVGKCKNPKCPYPNPFDLYKNNRLASTKGPCGSDQCPYAALAPCASPNCPFKYPPPCLPDKEDEIKKNRKLSLVKEERDKSYAKTCPFDNPPTIVNTMEIISCTNPSCPGKNRDKEKKREDCSTRKEPCWNPSCPYNKKLEVECLHPSQDSDKKGSAGGDSSSKGTEVSANVSIDESSTISSACLNVACPFAIAKKEKEQSPSKEACANPECPFNEPSLESCKNPECPFMAGSTSFGSKESCDNPQCPFKQSSEDRQPSDGPCECENPLCPSKRDTCRNPDCPFNLRGYQECRNPDCSHRRDAIGNDLGFCATPDLSVNEFCEDKVCPYHGHRIDAKNEADKKATVAVDGLTAEETGVLEKKYGVRASIYDLTPCNVKTCKFMGGIYACAECGTGKAWEEMRLCPHTCPGDPICPRAYEKDPSKKWVPKHVKRTLIKKMPQYDFPEGRYPGYKIGHRECLMPYFSVPPNMGWLWNIHTPCMKLKPRRGWRPGAICRTVGKAIIKHHKEKQLIPQEEGTRKRKRNHYDFEFLSPKPTLEVKKREGKYLITMNPLKDPNILKPAENPYLDVTPMQFTVAKDILNDPDIVCRDEGEHYKDNSSSDDEFDIEITTPAGIIHPDRPVSQPEVKTEETQYVAQKVEKKDKKEKKGKKGKKGKKIK